VRKGARSVGVSEATLPGGLVEPCPAPSAGANRLEEAGSAELHWGSATLVELGGNKLGGGEDALMSNTGCAHSSIAAFCKHRRAGRLSDITSACVKLLDKARKPPQRASCQRSAKRKHAGV